jgi:hypothetical protein
MTEVRGVVVEPGTDQPVADADITVFFQETAPVVINGGWKPDNSKRTTTDATGAFAVSVKHPGKYRIQAKKAGYAAAGGLRGEAELKLTTEENVADLKLFLARFGALTGSLVDDDTGKPISKFRLRAVRARTRGPRFLSGDTVSGETGADGQFVFAGLPPGDYSVEIPPQSAPEKRVLTQFTEKDLETVDLDYERTYWPGGQGPEVTVPVTVRSGATVQVGTLRARKTAHYRVDVHIPKSNCEPEDMMRVAEAIGYPSGGFAFGPPLGRTRCGKDILVTGHPPGSFRMLLDIEGRSRENRGTASIPFAITDENITLVAPILPGVTVDGAIVTAEGSKPPEFGKLQVTLIAADLRGSVDDDRPTPGSDGRFRLSYVRPIGHTVSVSGLGITHYVKEIRYSGHLLSGGTVPLEEAALEHVLTIVVDDKVAAIAGSVATADGPVNGATVLAAKWPLGIPLSGSGKAQTDATGSFRIAGLAPGEYRVAALRSTAGLANLTMTDFERILEAGMEVKLSPGALQNISLKLSELTPQ